MTDAMESALRHALEAPLSGAAAPIHCAVLGHPIAHSLSPVLHMAAYQALGLDGWVYERRDVRESELHDFLSACASTGDSWAGLSLTMPLKRTIMPFGTPANTWAAQLGIANTAVFQRRDDPDHPLHDSRPGTGASTMLYNTDVDGIIGAIAPHLLPRLSQSAQSAQSALSAQLQQRTPDRPPDHPAPAVILGNGSTALSAVAACSTFDGITDVVVAARHPENSDHIRTFLTHHAARLAMRHSDLSAVTALMPQAALVVSTLPAHIADPIAQEIRDAHMHVDGVLLDVAYNPRPSLLNRVWEQAGGISITGDEMLLYQAIPQVEVITRPYCSHFDRVRVEYAMRQALRGILQ